MSDSTTARRSGYVRPRRTPGAAHVRHRHPAAHGATSAVQRDETEAGTDGDAAAVPIEHVPAADGASSSSAATTATRSERSGGAGTGRSTRRRAQNARTSKRRRSKHFEAHLASSKGARRRYLRGRRYMRRAWSFAPRMGTTIAIGVGTLASLAPGLLPRTPEAQGVLMGLLTAVALAITGLLRLMLRNWGLYTETTRMRRVAVAATALLVIGAALHAGTSQNKLRAPMGTPLIGVDYWLRGAIGAAVIAGALFGLAKGIGWVFRSLRQRRRSNVTPVPAVDLTLTT